MNTFIEALTETPEEKSWLYNADTGLFDDESAGAEWEHDTDEESPWEPCPPQYMPSLNMENPMPDGDERDDGFPTREAAEEYAKNHGVEHDAILKVVGIRRW